MCKAYQSECSSLQVSYTSALHVNQLLPAVASATKKSEF